MNKKTKIVATIGPKSNSENTISQMIDAGMNVARLNFSHGNHKEHKSVIETIRKLDKDMSKIGILQDIAGPKIRIGEIEGDSLFLSKGSKIILTEKVIIGNHEKITVNLKNFASCVHLDDRILINDGIVELIVINIEGEEVLCIVENEGMISTRKGISLPSRTENLKLLSEKDIKDINFGIDLDVDFMAVSFVRNASDIKEVRKIISSRNSTIKIIAKIEKPEALENFDAILEEADGIMIARGDLGVEIPFEKVPLIQKELIMKTRLAGKPVITATQMLASMVDNFRPTRAEVTDVANAVLDGTDAVMLSEESAVGHDPVLAVKTMSKLVCEIEKNLNSSYNFITEPQKLSPDLYVAENACRLASSTKAEIIVCFTISGATARKVSRFKPVVSVTALSQSKKTCRELSLSWGVNAFTINPVADFEEMLAETRKILTDNGLTNNNAYFVITCGIPFNQAGNTNICGVFKT